MLYTVYIRLNNSSSVVPLQLTVDEYLIICIQESYSAAMLIIMNNLKNPSKPAYTK